MCHGHPRFHPCNHSSVLWYYCPSALIDLSTGAETPCANVSFAPSQRSASECPLLHCRFLEKCGGATHNNGSGSSSNNGGGWTCCACKQGPNTRGWCTMPLNRLRRNVCTFVVEEVETTCDHGCCGKCIAEGPEREHNLMPEMAFPELQKGSASRKFGYGSPSRSHRRDPAFSLMAGLNASNASLSTTPSPSDSRTRPTGQVGFEVDGISNRTRHSQVTWPRRSEPLVQHDDDEWDDKGPPRTTEQAVGPMCICDDELD